MHPSGLRSTPHRSASDLDDGESKPRAPSIGVTLRVETRPAVRFAGLSSPTAVRFHPDGRVFVAEKRGRVVVFDSLADTTATTFVDISDHVHNYVDRGLLGLALHPDFAAQPYVYLLYTLDDKPGGGTWGDTCPTPPGGTAEGCVVHGRLSRFRAAGNQADGAEQVLIEDWCQQFPSHSIGSLAFGSDGALYVTGGDGASFTRTDHGQDGVPINPCGDPPVGVGGTQTAPTAEGGALRSQDLRSQGDPVSLDGTLLRLDPATGQGMADNPLFGGGTATDDGIIAYGLRNPFRFALRPGTREIWIGDVGWDTWEEINVVADRADSAIENFGWPCYEGNGRQPGYDSPNYSLCESLYADTAAHTGPLYTYHHGAAVVSGDGCGSGNSAVSGLAFYDAANFPPEYAGALFFADYARDCVWTMLPDANGRPDPTRRQILMSGGQGPVDLLVGPNGYLYYAAIRSNEVRRIRYLNSEPFARLSANQTHGATPLVVQFDGRTSTDPNSDPLSYRWDFDGNGTWDDTSAAPSHTYTVSGNYTARLRVTDPGGLYHEATVVIEVNNNPPTAVIDTPLASLLWSAGDTIGFSGHATIPSRAPCRPPR